MSLPVVVTPTFTMTIPSTQKSVNYRPFLVKEEKILYIALEGGEDADIHSAVRDILAACINGVDVNTLAPFDVEYMFVQLRSKSVGEVITLRMKHSEDTSKDSANTCSFIQDVEVQLSDIYVEIDSAHSKKIPLGAIIPQQDQKNSAKNSPAVLGNDLGVVMKYPNVFDESLQAADPFDVVAGHIESVWTLIDGEQSVVDDFTFNEIRAWVETLSTDQFAAILRFFESMPALEHTVEYKCSKCGKEEKVVIKGLNNFFT